MDKLNLKEISQSTPITLKFLLKNIYQIYVNEYKNENGFMEFKEWLTRFENLYYEDKY